MIGPKVIALRHEADALKLRLFEIRALIEDEEVRGWPLVHMRSIRDLCVSDVPAPSRHRQIAEPVFTEVLRQRELKAAGKFDETAGDKMARGDSDGMLRILVEEVGEVARALNDNEPAVKLREELRQVAAVALDALVGLDHVMVEKCSAL